MITPDEALKRIFDNAPILLSVSAPLAECEGRILAEDLGATEDLPPFDHSAMDGYAVRMGDVRGSSREKPVRLLVREAVRAGHLAQEDVRSGEAIKIMTGVPLPSGADAVVMKEMGQSDGNGRVTFFHSPRRGENIRRKGEDVHSGQILLKAGTHLRPYEIALLASQGLLNVKVIQRPVAAVLATGDELAPVNEALSPGKIRNSNGPAMMAALSRWGIPAFDLGIVPDDEKEMEKRLREALSKADVVLVSGGVSVGDFDYTKSLFDRIGVREVFWKAAIKPGKPLFFGVYPTKGGPDKLVFGLPGNPVAVLVCLEEFVRPALEKLRGHKPKHPSYHLQGRVTNAYSKPKDRQQYIFCRVVEQRDGFHLEIIRPQGSAMMGMACQAEALAVAPLGMDRINPGDILSFRWLK